MAVTQKRSYKALYLLLILALILIGLAVWDMVMVGRNSAQDAQFTALITRQYMRSQALVQTADQAVAGSHGAFQDLLDMRQQFDTSIGELQNGNPQTGLPAASGDADRKSTRLNS